jgi:hypothetical protein
VYNFRVKIRVLLACLIFVWSIPTTAQITGEFYLDKTVFAPGEPVFLYLKILNKGPDIASFAVLMQEQPFCSGVSLTISSDPPKISIHPDWTGCSWNGGPFPMMSLMPGQTTIGRFPLNYYHDINAPGNYWVEAKYFAFPNPAGVVPLTKLSFSVDGKLPSYAPSNYQPWLDQLKSTDQDTRQEAARVLASLAPPSLEETLYGFANNSEFRRYAPLAFHRLNTPRSMQAMADLMKGPLTNEQLDAARYLAESNDQQWYPLLRDAAIKNVGDSTFPACAAELGGEKMLPVLIDLAKSADNKGIEGNALMAMGSTGSRNAIPVLLEYLNDPDSNISDRAGYGLMLLTHRSAVVDSRNRDRKAEAVKWMDWWKREGATAPIYKATEQGERVPLP